MKPDSPECSPFQIEDSVLVKILEPELKEVIIPDGITRIGEKAFYEHPSLITIQIPDSVQFIDSDAFSFCRNLRYITFPKNLGVVSANVIHNCPNLRTIQSRNPNLIIAGKTRIVSNSLDYIDLPLLMQLAKNILSINELVSYVSRCYARWHTLTDTQVKEQSSFLKRRITLKNEIFQSDEAALIAYLLAEQKSLDLRDIDDYLNISISHGRTEITALFLEYKNNHYTTEQLDANENHKDMLEIGFVYPTVQEFRKKWRFQELDGGICISAYKGMSLREVIPSQLADGRKIISMRKNGKRNDFSPIEELVIDADLMFCDIFNWNFTFKKVKFHGKLPHSFIADFCYELETFDYSPQQPCDMEMTFSNCGKLESFAIPEGVKIIRNSAFQGCRSLSNLEIPKSVESIESNAFDSCPQLQTILLPQGITTIPTQCFGNCTALSSITIPDSVKVIEANAFMLCTALTNLTIPDSVVKIQEHAFSSCRSLQQITLSQSLTMINNKAFYDCENLQSVSLPPSMSYLGAAAFFDCMSLSSVEIPNSISTMESLVFGNCYSLTNIIIPDSVVEIHEGAFANCTALQSLTIPDSVKKIHKNAFSHCPKLTIYGSASSYGKSFSKRNQIPFVILEK